MKISAMWATVFLVSILLFVLIYVLQKNMLSSKDKWAQFECGFELMTPSHLPFSFQFFLVAILFLIFDIEIAMILSYPMEKVVLSSYILILSFIFLVTLGLLYEWQKGKLDWSK